MEIESNKIPDKDKTLSSEIIKEEHYWTEEVKRISRCIGNLEDIPLGQVDIHSSMARLDEYRMRFVRIYEKHNSKLKINEAKKIKEVYESPYKYTQRERDVLVYGELAEQYNLVEFLNSHIEFLLRKYQALDKLAYAVKNRIELEKYYSAGIIVDYD